MTGAIVAQLDGSVTLQYLYTSMYYDNKKRLIQSCNLHHFKGTETEYIAYNFTGQPVSTQKVHIASGKDNQIEYYTYDYDHALRPVKTTHRINTGAPVILAHNSYDELGRLKSIAKAGHTNLTTSYSYNIRSWTKSISSPLFKQELHYNTSFVNNTPKYNGDITAIGWQVQGENQRTYSFRYDHLSMLTHAAYNNVASGGLYNTYYNYDKHGNIKILERRGKINTGTETTSYGYIDNLAFNYVGNQLNNVHDAAPNILMAESADFKDGSKDAIQTKQEYTYNKNGALVKDLNKDITDIQYNSLNLPQQMVINSPSAKAKNYYAYSASGVKLKTEQRYDPNLQKTPVSTTTPANDRLNDYKITNYVSNKIYQTHKNGNNTTNTLKILIDGGYIENGIYYFYLTDHLGNNRVVADHKGNVIQKSHYYPFGMTFAEGITSEQGKQPYKYNGKELDAMHNLNLYDYSARYYEPGIGRFTSVDPHAENYYSWSPYAYTFNTTHYDLLTLRGWSQKKMTL